MDPNSTFIYKSVISNSYQSTCNPTNNNLSCNLSNNLSYNLAKNLSYSSAPSATKNYPPSQKLTYYPVSLNQHYNPNPTSTSTNQQYLPTPMLESIHLNSPNQTFNNFEQVSYQHSNKPSRDSLSLPVNQFSPQSPECDSNCSAATTSSKYQHSVYCSYILESGDQCHNKVGYLNEIKFCYRHQHVNNCSNNYDHLNLKISKSSLLNNQKDEEIKNQNSELKKKPGVYICTHPDCLKIIPRKQYKYPCLLNSHQKIHSTEKPHSCSICSSKFLRLHDLNRHIRNMHQDLKCNRCNLSLQKFEMRNHLKSVHNAK
ncbi:hypothetical protein HDU92_008664 [Lobulomyces angularis]|nr:hypothetical protein HDU92_008664 [Lobulomyces angularis]